MWRWRKATYSFNLTIVHSEKELQEIDIDNICKKRFIADYKKQIKIYDKMMHICTPNFLPNINMTRTAIVSIRLGDFMSLPANFDIKSKAL
jgi:hypothetical protein